MLSELTGSQEVASRLGSCRNALPFVKILYIIISYHYPKQTASEGKMIDDPDSGTAVMKGFHGRDIFIYYSAFLLNAPQSIYSPPPV
jgi:hypothetical protein